MVVVLCVCVCVRRDVCASRNGSFIRHILSFLPTVLSLVTGT